MHRSRTSLGQVTRAAVLPFALSCLTAVAEETGHADAAGHAEAAGNPLTQFDPGLLLWTIITFVVLVVILRWKAWPSIVKALRDRETAVRGAIDDARRQRLEAEKLLEEHRKLMVEARRETAALVDQGRRDAERVRQELLETARREQQEVLEQGRRQIAQETKAALASLQERTVDLALAASEKLLKKTLDGDAHRRLVEETLKEISSGTRPPS